MRNVRNNKRILAIVMTLMMVFSLMPGMAFADTAAYPSTGQSGVVTNNRSISITMVQPSASKIVTDTDVTDYYSNTINGKLDAESDIVFKFVPSGTGYSEKHLAGIQSNTYPNIKIYKASNYAEITDGNLVASKALGNLSFTETYEASLYAAYLVDITVKANELSQNSTYALVFDDSIYGNQSAVKLGKDIVFFFETGVSTSDGSEGQEPEEPAENPYGLQGEKGQRIRMTNPSEIIFEGITELTINGETKNQYNNVIKTEYVAGTAETLFTYQIESGANNFKESSLNNYLKDIKIIDSEGNDTGLTAEYVGFASKNITIKFDFSTLEAGTYILRFPPTVQGNNNTKITDCYIDFKFTVVNPIVETTGITLNKDNIELTVGDKDTTLIATVAPENATDKTVAWTSSDDTVATVDANGIITAVKAGTATITATTANGLTATCTVTVEAAEAPGGGDDSGNTGGDDQGTTPGGDQTGDNDQNAGGEGDKEQQPEDKDKTDKTTQTGDDMNMGLYLLIMMIAMAVASGAVVYKRQRQ